MSSSNHSLVLLYWPMMHLIIHSTPKFLSSLLLYFHPTLSTNQGGTETSFNNFTAWTSLTYANPQNYQQCTANQIVTGGQTRNAAEQLQRLSRRSSIYSVQFSNCLSRSRLSVDLTESRLIASRVTLRIVDFFILLSMFLLLNFILGCVIVTLPPPVCLWMPSKVLRGTSSL